MPIERNIGSTLVEAEFLERATALTGLADVKEFSLDTADTMDSERPHSTTCGGGKCAGPCVQRCLPPPPPPKCR